MLDGDSAMLVLRDAPALQWARETYQSREFRRVRDRYIHVCTLLVDERPGPKRGQLVDECSDLRTGC